MGKGLSLGQKINILVERMEYLSKRVEAHKQNPDSSRSLNYNYNEIAALQAAVELMTAELTKRKSRFSTLDNSQNNP